MRKILISWNFPGTADHTDSIWPNVLSHNAIESTLSLLFSILFHLEWAENFYQPVFLMIL
jgi:hypothetical protein